MGAIFTVSAGEHIIVRGEEFIVQKTEKLGEDNSLKITAVGVSELTRGHTFVFRTDLEFLDGIKKVEPKNTVFVEDNSAGARKTIVFLENAVRGSYGFFDDWDSESDTGEDANAQVFVADRCAADNLPYQYEPFYKILRLPRPRFLIADAVGLGKTIEIGIILSEMIHRGRGQRILVCTMKSILMQFQEDIWNRFAIPLVRLDSLGVDRIRQEVPIGANPFNYIDKAIISIDTLKNSVKFRNYLENTRWDIVVVDEIHTAANASTLRGGLVKLLSEHCDSLIFASATPHNGKAESFAGIMRMLEPSLVPVAWDYQIDNKDAEQKQSYQDLLNLWRSYFVRRSKQDIGTEAGSQFREREIIPLEFRLNDHEQVFLKLQQRLKSLVLKDWNSHNGGRGRDITQLFPVTLFKSFLSSPVAAAETIQNRLKKLEGKLSSGKGTNDQDLLQEIGDLNELAETIRNESTLAGRANDSRYQCFIKTLRDTIKWKGDAASPRIVVFTEREETLKYLCSAVIADFGLENQLETDSGAAGSRTAKTGGRGRKKKVSPENTGTGSTVGGGSNKVVKVFSGKMTDTELQSLVENFSLEKSPIRMLITTDAGSVGINLHFFCHIMFNYDIPWSLITLDQRNGRIDRYGQRETPEIYYLIARTSDRKMDNSRLAASDRERESQLDFREEEMTDLRIISRLISKEDEVHKTLHGEASAIMSLYEPEKEEARTSRAVAEGDEDFLEKKSPEAVSENGDPDDDFIQILLSGGDDGMFGDTAGISGKSGLPLQVKEKTPRQFSRRISFYGGRDERENTFRFYKDLFRALKNYAPYDGGLSDGEEEEFDNERVIRINLQKSDSLRESVLDILPRECIPEDRLMKFSSDIDNLKNSIMRARNSGLDDHRWSEFNVLYAQHPVMSYYISLFDSLIGREKALAVSTPEIPEDEVWFFCHGIVPNTAGAPVINEFYVARACYRILPSCDEAELGDFRIVNCLDLLNSDEGRFLRKPDIRCRHYVDGELGFIQNNFWETFGSEAVWHYFQKLTDRASRQLEKSRNLQMANLEKWRDLSLKNVNASRVEKARKNKLLGDITKEYERCRDSYSSFYSLKSIGAVSEGSDHIASDSTGPENISIRVLAVFSNITSHFKEQPGT